VSRVALFLTFLPVFGCADAPAETARASRETLMDPATCRSCHEDHFAEWAQSMHAYASKDPLFVAQNRQGQQDTNGALGDFCIRCHAPMAALTGASSDGLNLEELPEPLSGVTCFFCHNAGSVSGTHNNAVALASDRVLRGGIHDPVENSVHASGYSSLLAAGRAESAALCGACHDVVTPPPPLGYELPIERTFSEWSDSVFAPAHAANESTVLTCSGCHMPTLADEPIATGGGLPSRPRHQHLFPAVDVALTPFPTTGVAAIDEDGQNERQVRELLDTTLRVDLCVQTLPGQAFAIEVTLDNANAGHAFPSGSTHNRDVWVEVRASDAEGRALYESGVSYAAGSVPDPDLWLLGDRAHDEAGETVHAFWRAAGIERRALAAAMTSDRTKPEFYRNHAVRRFPLALDAAIDGLPAIVSVRVRMRPVPRAALDELIEASYLAESVSERLQVHELLPHRHWADVPELATLAESTFEWSAAVRDSGLFDVWRDATSLFAKDCVGMPSQRGARR